jgi:hypothetical protein
MRDPVGACACGESFVQAKRGPLRTLCDDCKRSRQKRHGAAWAEKHQGNTEEAEARRVRRRALHRASVEARLLTDPTWRSDRNRMNAFGLSRDEIRALREHHNGRCAVCDSVPKAKQDGRDPLNIDHRHDNGVVRGMLCARCNLLVATFDLEFTDSELFRRLRDYSRRGAPSLFSLKDDSEAA